MLDRLLFRIIVIVLIAGTIYRLFPVVTGQPDLSEFFMTEDGYLMLTVARNIAIGLGMSVSDGTIATNGVQPLATFLFAIPYVLTGGDKVTSLIGIHLISALIAVGGVFVVRAFAVRVLERQDDRAVWAWLVAALWSVSPLLVRHTMNGLETGLYTLVAVLTLLQFARLLAKGDQAGLSDRLLLGALCGLAFLSRNDAVFLVTSIFVVWALYELITRRTGIIATAARLIPPGVVSLLVSAPWLINNQIKFGSIVPISGSAQSFGSSFGQNLQLVPVKLFEYLFPMLPVPGALETNTAFVAVCIALVLGIMGWFLIQSWKRGGTIRLVIAAYAIHCLLLALYYGLFFGAPHFISRYLSVAAPLMIIATLSVALDLFGALLKDKAGAAIAVSGLAGLALSMVLLGMNLRPGAVVQGHTQVVQWVEENVPDETWVGAVQTGTLGYWHDRTINLDGKVNPDALAALVNEGHVLRYVVASPIEYVVDWAGVASWAERTDAGFSGAFELLFHDADRNLAVLHRRG
jgi:hypothetical protein